MISYNRHNTLIDEVNILRSDPAAYANVVMLYEPMYRSRDINAFNEVIDELNKLGPLSTLQKNDVLMSYAQTRTQINSKNNQMNHSDLGEMIMDPSLTSQRIQKLSENLALGYYTAVDIVVAWLVDAGVPNRGHRKNLLEPDINISGEAYANGHATQIYGRRRI